MHVDDSVVVVKCEFNNAYFKHQSKFQKVQEKKEKEKEKKCLRAITHTHWASDIIIVSYAISVDQFDSARQYNFQNQHANQRIKEI